MKRRLTIRRKEYIHKFRLKRSRGIGTPSWFTGLIKYLVKCDDRINSRVVKHWVKIHPWIIKDPANCLQQQNLVVEGDSSAENDTIDHSTVAGVVISPRMRPSATRSNFNLDPYENNCGTENSNSFSRTFRPLVRPQSRYIKRPLLIPPAGSNQNCCHCDFCVHTDPLEVNLSEEQNLTPAFEIPESTQFVDTLGDRPPFLTSVESAFSAPNLWEKVNLDPPTLTSHSTFSHQQPTRGPETPPSCNSEIGHQSMNLPSTTFVPFPQSVINPLGQPQTQNLPSTTFGRSFQGSEISQNLGQLQTKDLPSSSFVPFLQSEIIPNLGQSPIQNLPSTFFTQSFARLENTVLPPVNLLPTAYSMPERQSRGNIGTTNSATWYEYSGNTGNGNTNYFQPENLSTQHRRGQQNKNISLTLPVLDKIDEHIHSLRLICSRGILKDGLPQLGYITKVVNRKRKKMLRWQIYRSN